MNIKTLRLFLFCLGLIPIIIVIGCNPILYTPPAQHVPLLKKQGEGEVRFSLGTRGYSLQGAYAGTNEYAFLFDARQSVYKQEQTYYSELSSRQHRETTILLGMGRYGTLGDGKKGRWGFYGGLGWGRSCDTPLTGSLFAEAEARYWQVFMQPQIGFEYKMLEGTLSLRANYTDIGNVRSTAPAYDGKHFVHLTLEPAATLGFGYDPVKLFAQIGETFGGKVFNQTSDNLSGRLNMTFGIKAQIR